MAWAGLGTDTGGSIRIPASLCGIVGLKPTYGRVSLRGVMPLSWNVDHAGPLTKSVKDAALMLQVMAGYDKEDPGSMDMRVENYTRGLTGNIKGLRIGFIQDDFINESDVEVLKLVSEGVYVFKKLGAKVKSIQVEWLKDAAANNALITQADGAAFHRERFKEHPEWFGADVRMRLETGAGFTSSEYALARRKQVEFRRRSEVLMESFDVLILPTTPIPAPILEGENALERAKQLTRFTAPFNNTGMPALSIPCGFTKDGLPVGLQIVGRHWNEAGILQAGYAYEKNTEWHKWHPNL
jgi:aspartyl-tRNA(Asn)/glutamyl-tRNA(Gln) amidotransferase subunit A